MSIIKSLSVGNGDMFYIKHNSDNFTIIDCCMPDDIRAEILDELEIEVYGKNIVRFISTHPDQDHIRGLADLHARMKLRNFYCVKNAATKSDGPTKDFNKYCQLRDDASIAFYLQKGAKRKWMNVNDDTRGSAGIEVLWPVTTNEDYKSALEDASEGYCPNNISTILTYSIQNGPSFMWMGDLDTAFMESIENQVALSQVDILFAPHHGRDSGRVPSGWLDIIQPKIIVVGEAPSEHLHYYPGFETITQNWAGDITFECLTGKARIYVSNKNYELDYLDYEIVPDQYGKYIGTLITS